MAEPLKIKIDADVQSAVNGMTAVEKRTNDLQKSIVRLQNIIATTTSQQRLASSLDAVKNRQSELNKIMSSTPRTLSGLSNSVNQSTIALTNLGRVVQDAPFGFLGIANNLNPLLESFQRLKATSGTTGGALKALGKSLIGPGGIGIALSVVSSLLIVFGDRLFGAGKKAKETEDAMSALAKSIAEPIVKLTSLVGIIKNVNVSWDDKQKALKKINDEYGKYLDALGREEISLKNLESAYDRIIDQLIRQAVVKGIQDEISKAVEKSAKALIAVGIAQEKERIESEKSVEAKGQLITQEEKLQKSLERFNKSQTDGLLAQQQSVNATNAQVAGLNNYEAVQKRIREELTKTLDPLLKLVTNFEDLGETLSKPKDEKVKKFLIDVQRFINDNPPFIFIRDFKFDKDAVESFISDMEKQFGERPVQIDLSLPTESQIKNIDNLRKAFSDLGERGREAFAKIKQGTDISAFIQEGQTRLVQLQNEFAVTAQFADILGNSFVSIFEAIQAGKSPIKAFFDFMIQELSRLIAKLIATKIAATFLNAIFPGAGTAVGALTGGIASPSLSGIGSSISSRSFANNLNITVTGSISGDVIRLSGNRSSASAGGFG